MIPKLHGSFFLKPGCAQSLDAQCQVCSQRPYGSRAVLKFAQYSGCTVRARKQIGKPVQTHDAFSAPAISKEAAFALHESSSS